MINHLYRRALKILLICFFTGTGGVIAQSISIPDFNVNVCPNSNFDAPLNFTGFQHLDTISVTFTFDAAKLDYLTTKLPLKALTDSGFYALTEPAANQVRFTWGAKPGRSISFNDVNILTLVFKALGGNDSIGFDQSAYFIQDRYGNIISPSYDGAVVNTFAPMTITIEEINSTCPEACDANVAVYVRGGEKPYEYLWNGRASIFDSVQANACGGPLLIEITDINNCKLDTTFMVSELDSASVELITTPDTIYMQNPVVQFAFEADDSVVDWSWDFGDNTQSSREKNPFHIYSSAINPNDDDGYTVRLTTVTESGCTKITSVFLPISELPIFIPNVFTPNESDQINNYFVIAKKLSSDPNGDKIPITTEYMRMELLVFDRWGRKVYDDNDYSNDWDGDNLPEGTYYYRLNTYGYYKNESFKGAVTILR